MMPVVDLLVREIIQILFFFNDTATTEIYTLSLHDALPIWRPASPTAGLPTALRRAVHAPKRNRSEEHTSELQSQSNLVCRRLLEKEQKPVAGRPPACTPPSPLRAHHRRRQHGPTQPERDHD